MKRQLRVFPDSQIVACRVSGPVTLRDLLALTQELHHTTSDSGPVDDMLDLTESDLGQLYFSDMLAVARRIETLESRMPAFAHFVILAPDDMQFGTARMLQQAVPEELGIEIEVCRTKSEVLQALHVGPIEEDFVAFLHEVATVAD